MLVVDVMDIVWHQRECIKASELQCAVDLERCLTRTTLVARSCLDGVVLETGKACDDGKSTMIVDL